METVGVALGGAFVRVEQPVGRHGQSRSTCFHHRQRGFGHQIQLTYYRFSVPVIVSRHPIGVDLLLKDLFDIHIPLTLVHADRLLRPPEVVKQGTMAGFRVSLMQTERALSGREKGEMSMALLIVGCVRLSLQACSLARAHFCHLDDRRMPARRPASILGRESGRIEV